MNRRPEIDLRTLYYFTVLAEEKHFGVAAKRIGIEQPPLSLQIKKLEEKLGGKLFERNTKHIRLTETGEALLPEALKLLADSQNLVEYIRQMNRGEAGVLRIGFTSSTIFCGIPEIIQQHKKIYPHVEFLLKERSPTDQITELQSGSLDLAFIREPEQAPGIITNTVIPESFVAVLAHNHPLAQKTKLKLKDLAREPFVLFPKTIAPTLYDKMRQLFSQAQFHPNVVQEAFEWQTIVNLVEANLGVSICPSSFQKLKIGEIKYLPLGDVRVQTGVSICQLASNNSPLIKPFLELLNKSNRFNFRNT